jgi:UDP-N-acetylglucosamine:LPS N-acetylglucosamine transferase
VAEAAAGRYAPRRRQMLRDLDELRRNPVTLEAMRAASARLGRPDAGDAVAALLGGLTGTKAPRHG